jgi:hypothetical protein
MLPPLHKHTGRLSWELAFAGLLIVIKLAEDPAKPLLLRCWAHQSADRTEQTDLWFSLVRVHRVFEDGERVRCWRLNAGPLSVWFGRLPL